MPGLNLSRVDTLPAASVVIDEVMEITGASTLSVAGQGLREGLLWQEIRPGGAVITDVRAASIAGLARANGVDERAAEPVVAAAIELFKATEPLHAMSAADLELLVCAARLAGIGMHVDYYNRDRHAEYLVHSGDVRGFDHREVVMLAALVRWARSGTPDLSPYKAVVRPDDARRAAMLSTLLGVARAICRRNPSPVSQVSAALTRGTLALLLHANAPIEAEILDIERQQKRLEAVFKVSLTASAVQDP